MIKIVATSIIKEGMEEKFLEIAKQLVDQSQKEPGNIFYTVNQSMENPREFCFIECWRDQQALDIHNASVHFTTLVPQLGQVRESGMLHKYIEL